MKYTIQLLQLILISIQFGEMAKRHVCFHMCTLKYENPDMTVCQIEGTSRKKFRYTLARKSWFRNLGWCYIRGILSFNGQMVPFPKKWGKYVLPFSSSIQYSTSILVLSPTAQTLSFCRLDRKYERSRFG